MNFNRISPENGDYVSLGSINLTNFTLEAWINLYNLDFGEQLSLSGAVLEITPSNFAIWNRKIGIQLSGPGETGNCSRNPYSLL